MINQSLVSFHPSFATAMGKKRKVSKNTFPHKLYNMLESNKYSDVVHWTPDGKA